MNLKLEKSRFIPFSRSDLVRLLLEDSRLSQADRNKLNQLCDLLMHVFHFEFHKTLETLKSC